MADEITLNVSLSVTNGNFKHQWRPGTLQIDQTNGRMAGHVQTIGTSSETVDFGSDLTAEGVCYMRNLDATNFIEIGPDSTGIVDFIKLKPGEFWVGRLKPTVVVKAQADTAACDLQVAVFDD